jgi:AraC-like DNA-binding protein
LVRESESVIELAFDCGPQAALKRVEMPGLTHLRLEAVSGTVLRTSTGQVSLPSGINALCYNASGTLLVRTAVQGKLIIIPPRSATFIRGGVRMICQAARGEHSVQVLTWQNNMTPLLEMWVAQRAAGKAGVPSRHVACKPIDPHLKESYDKFWNARSGLPELFEMSVLSTLYETVSKLMLGGDEVQLAALPGGLPETIQELTVKVRKAPAAPWPLREAADTAGYSPFHFSRVFKQQVGYGFHEYVDRCRTEMAVELLVTTDLAVDIIGGQCGFGTTQGLRESVKEYLGLVPSELRAVPESFESVS